MFFNDCDSMAEAKDLFRRLSLCLHPDKNGDSELFRILKDEYEYVKSGRRYTNNEIPRFNQISYTDALKRAEVARDDLRRQLEKITGELAQLATRISNTKDKNVFKRIWWAIMMRKKWNKIYKGDR